jgi:DNA-3-methyladenine glycosylase I
MTKIRCPWVNLNNPRYVMYHDEEWGRPVFTDERHFEYLLLETFQAGLSWEIILNKRENFRQALFQFSLTKMKKATEIDIKKWMMMPGLIRHEGKFKAAIMNAKVFSEIQSEFGSFHAFIMSFTNGKIIHHHPRVLNEIPTIDPIAHSISATLKKRGMKYVGPTIIYAHLQAMGVIDDHIENCFCKKALINKY